MSASLNCRSSLLTPALLNWNGKNEARPKLDRDNLDNVPEAGGDEVSREPELGVVRSVDILHQHVHVPVVPLLRQGEQRVKVLNQFSLSLI